MEAFRCDRDLDGWRLQEVMDSARELEEKDASRAMAAGDYPLLTRATYQLVLHTYALRRLFNTVEPRVTLIRPTERHKIRYACGDASAEGFAQAVQYPDLTIDERDGLWLPEFAEKSSNLREALNIANHLKHDIMQGKHDGCELWQATDNAVWAAVCNKGMSSARHLFDLLVEIKVLCHEHEVFYHYHCFHISGERMIATGIDGLSRGDHESGIALGYDLRDFLPLDVRAFDYPDNSLTEWCKSWMGGISGLLLLQGNGFLRHTSLVYISLPLRQRPHLMHLRRWGEGETQKALSRVLRDFDTTAAVPGRMAYSISERSRCLVCFTNW
jgi:hypothetical protein